MASRKKLSQLDLFSLPVPSNGVATSDAAAASIGTDVGRLRALVLGYIQTRGGLTCDEVELASGLSHQTASARINDLHRLGRIVDSGDRRKTRSGRNAIVWRVPALLVTE